MDIVEYALTKPREFAKELGALRLELYNNGFAREESVRIIFALISKRGETDYE